MSDDKYLSLSFNSPYDITFGEVIVPIQPITSKLVAKATISDGTTTITSAQTDSLTDGKKTTVRFTFSTTTLKAGTITVKVFVYGQSANNGFRLGSPVQVSGEVMAQIFVGGDSYEWNNPKGWLSGHVPTIADDVILRNNATLYGYYGKKSGHGEAKSIRIDKYEAGQQSRKLSIWPNSSLIVAEDIKAKHEGDADYVATTPEDLEIRTSVLGNGVLICGGASTTTAATYEFHTKTWKYGKWYINQYVGIPFATMIPDYQLSGFKIFEYDAENDQWKTPEEKELKAWVAYDYIRSYSGSTWSDFDLKDTLLLPGITGDGRLVNLECAWRNSADEKWTVENPFPISIDSVSGHQDYMFANSWTAPIDIASMDESDFTNLVNTIYMFNAGYVDPNGSQKEVGDEAGQWSTFPIAAAAAGSVDNAVIPATQAFLVTATAENAKLTLDYKKHVYDPAVEFAEVNDSVNNFPTRAPRRMQNMAVPTRLKIIVRSDSMIADQLYLLEREDFTNSFDNGWDGYKIFGNTTVPQLYMQSGSSKLAVGAVPDIEGTSIGFKAGTNASAYTFTFDYADDAEELYLYDKVTGEYTRVENGGTYSFTTTDNIEHARFVLTRDTYKTPTGFEDVEEEKAESTKFIKDEHLYILRDGRLYDATGRLVK